MYIFCKYNVKTLEENCNKNLRLYTSFNMCGLSVNMFISVYQ